MYLKKSTYKGRLYLVIAETYRVPGENKTSTRTVKRLGYLDELEHPIEYYQNMAQNMTKDKQEREREFIIKLDPNEKMATSYQSQKNIGYIVLQGIYYALQLDRWVNNTSRHRKFAFNMNQMARFLILSRLMKPASKLADFKAKDRYFDRFDFSLDDVYHSLSFFSERKNHFIPYLHKQIETLLGRDTSTTYYDVTNYYFEIDDPKDLKQKGCSKENRRTPIIQMGLLTDADGIPLDYHLYPGNTVDCQTYRPFLTRAKKDMDLGRIVVVADKGMHTGDNIAYTLMKGYGYLFSQTVRGASQSMKNYVLDQTGYQHISPNFKVKSRLEPREIWVSERDAKGRPTGRKKKYTVDEKQVVYYSEKYAQRARKEREKAIQKALKIIANPSSYHRLEDKGVNALIKHLKVDKKTGEILNPLDKLHLDEEKIKKDEKLDGYYILCTSEYKLSDDQIIAKYRDLWKIESLFKLSKTTLETRPVYLSTNAHIEGHFFICFVAMVIARVLEKLMEGSYSAEVLINELRQNNYQLVGRNVYQGSYHSEVLEAIGERFNVPFGTKNMTQGDIKKIIAETRKPGFLPTTFCK